MFGHDYVSGNVKAVPPSRFFEGVLENIAGVRSAEPRFAAVAAKREEVETARFLKSLEAPRHGSMVCPKTKSKGGITDKFFRISSSGKEVKTPALSLQRTQAQGQGRGSRFKARARGFLRSFTQLLARLPLVLLAEALTGRLRLQGIGSHQ